MSFFSKTGPRVRWHDQSEQEPVTGEDDARAEALPRPSAASRARYAQARDLGREPLGHAGNDLRVGIQWVTSLHVSLPARPFL